ncbi:MAG: hypothetical protein P8M49_00410, partial [Thalassotalea sp.]|nr:hypothetical protein [Thalassotalea sp.]
MIPLDPSFYDEFQYQSKGFFKDILGKKKETEKLRNLLSEVLKKYHLLKKPYFQNFIHTSNSLSSDNLDINDLGFNMQGSYSQISLFHEVLVREGFVELKEQPNLLNKLLFTTEFSFEYKGFEKEIQRHIKENLDKTITSWIAEVGIVYRDELCFLLYYLWKKN